MKIVEKLARRVYCLSPDAFRDQCYRGSEARHSPTNNGHTTGRRRQ
jgi:hypothetical protein